MSKRHNNAEFAGTESELTAKTKELDELHNDSAMSSMWAGVSDMIDGMRGAEGIKRSTSRRTFLDGSRRGDGRRCDFCLPSVQRPA